MSTGHTAPPRIEPIPESNDDPEVAELLAMVGNLAHLNIFRTMVRNPRIFKRWVPMGAVLLHGKLAARDRELLILRTAHRTECEYEWFQHVKIASGLGFSADEIDDVRAGADQARWTPFESALIRAVDEMLDDHRIGDATWNVLAAAYDERALIEALMVVGHYHSLGMTLNSLGVRPEGSDL